MNQQTIIQTLRDDSTRKYLHRYGIKHLWLFGSYAHGDFTSHSDIDILYEYDKSTPYQSWGAVKPLLYLQNKIKKKIDFVSKNTLDKALEKEVLSHSITVW